MVDGKQIAWSGCMGTACASDLGWAPHEWPAKVDVKGRTGVKTFYLDAGVDARDARGNLVSMRYVHRVQASPTHAYPVFTIVVFND